MTVGWARFCAHADTKPRGQTINLSAHPTLFSENKFTLIRMDTRILFHVTRGLDHIVARRSAGIATTALPIPP